LPAEGGQSEVGNSGAKVSVEQDVAWLDVEMDRIRGVDGRNSAAHLMEDAECEVHVGGAVAVRKPLLQGRAWNVFHDEVRRVVVDTERVDLNDIGVANPRHGPRFGHDTLANAVAEQTSTWELDGHVAIERYVVRQEHDAHGPRSECPPNAIASPNQRTRLRTSVRGRGSLLALRRRHNPIVQHEHRRHGGPATIAVDASGFVDRPAAA
jgi:hypothetical protein